MIGFFVVIVFSFIWYFPLYKKAKNKKIKTKQIVFALLLGMIPAFLLSIIVQFLIGLLCNALGITGIAKQVTLAVIGAGIFEEIWKFFAGKVACGKSNEFGAIDYILVFGAVGLGFEIVETLIGTNGVIGGIIRGIFLLHVIIQFYMGERYYRYKSIGDKKYLIKTFAVSMSVHAAFDCTVFVLSAAIGTESSDLNDSLLIAGIALLIVTLIMVIALIIKTIKLNRNALSEQEEGIRDDFLL